MAKKKDAVDALDNLYAKGAVVNLGEHRREAVQIPTGRPSIDYVTDGGIPKGRIILIAGEPSAGKSSLTIQIAEAVSDGRPVLYMDTEATLTSSYIESLGGNAYNFNHSIPSTTEELCNIIRKEIPNYKDSVIIVDSINNSASGEQVQKNAEERTMANRAIVMSAQLPIMVGMCNQYNTTLIILSQIRDNMDKGPNPKFAKKTVIPGGRSLHHNSSMTLELTASTKKKAKDSDELEAYDTFFGRLVRIECTKNKVGVPFRNVKVEFRYEEGFTIEADVAGAAIVLGIVTKGGGGWMSYGDTKVCQGQDKLTEVFKDNTELFEEIKFKVYEKMDRNKLTEDLEIQ